MKKKLLEDRIIFLEQSELEDLGIMARMTERIKDLELLLADTVEKYTVGLQSAHEVLVSLMSYLKVNFDDDGNLVKVKHLKKRK